MYICTFCFGIVICVYVYILMYHQVCLGHFSCLCRRPSGIDSEFFVQLFVEADKGMVLPTTQDLLHKMFKQQNITFAEVKNYVVCFSSTCLLFLLLLK